MKIQGLTGSDLFQIQTIQSYPEDYTETTKVAQDELSGNARPELAGMVDDMDSYEVIYLGYRLTNPRFTPEALKANMPLVDLLREWARCKEATPAQIALAWLLAQRPWIVPIPGTTNMKHLDEDLGAMAIKFTPAELHELNASASRIVIHGDRLRKGLMEMSGREAPLRNK